DRLLLQLVEAPPDVVVNLSVAGDARAEERHAENDSADDRDYVAVCRRANRQDNSCYPGYERGHANFDVAPLIVVGALDGRNKSGHGCLPSRESQVACPA